MSAVQREKVIAELKDARDYVSGAIATAERVDYPRAHINISKAHECLRNASRLLGYRPKGAV